MPGIQHERRDRGARFWNRTAQLALAPGPGRSLGTEQLSPALAPHPRFFRPGLRLAPRSAHARHAAVAPLLWRGGEAREECYVTINTRGQHGGGAAERQGNGGGRRRGRPLPPRTRRVGRWVTLAGGSRGEGGSGR